MLTVSVPAPSRSYCVHTGKGLLDRLGELTSSLPKASAAMIVSDSTVAPLYAGRVKTSLEAVGCRVEQFVFPAGEASKSLATLGTLLNSMAEARLSRSDRVFALGGGVTGDLAGLGAALYMRGIGLVQLPTSLLAAVDSSVGGKTAVDLEAGKNLVGAFYQPELVVCDTETFATLPPEQIANGFGEIVKTGILAGEDIFARASDPDPGGLDELIHRCVEYKRDVVCADEKEQGLRQVLNLGHTFGHAVEKCSGFALPHGYCVAIGLSLITAVCVKRGLCSAELFRRLTSALRTHGLPTGTELGADELFSAILADKKRAGDSVTLVLPRDVGRVERRKVSLAEARIMLEEALAAVRGLHE